MKDLFILGVDPGTTVGYALLDVMGKLVMLKSARDLPVEKLIQEVSPMGKIVVVGTDVCYSPRYVERVCSILGAKLFSPGMDVKEGVKDRLTDRFRVKDDHQRDALASALLAFDHVRATFEKVDARLKERGKEHLSDEVKLLAVKGLSVDDALRQLEDKIILSPKKRRVRGVSRVSQAYSENVRLREELVKLQQLYQQVSRRLSEVKKNVDSTIDLRVRKNVEVSKNHLRSLVVELENTKKDLVVTKLLVDRWKSLVLATDVVVLCHYDSLAFDSINNVHDGDVIVVHNPSVWSDKSLNLLRDRGVKVVYESTPPRSLLESDVVFVARDKVGGDDLDGFVIVDKDVLARECTNKELLGKIVEEYKKKRF
ncbi:MAG: DUF460 domain-containing protein [Nanoarchaeota archaeon]|nr:DUF460 domain-containing protein [Nanoarchaeota archaeon]